MLKKLISAILFTLIFVLNPPEAEAGLITILENGTATINVLSAQDNPIDIQKPSSLDINKVADTPTPESAVISLNKNEDKVNLNVKTDFGDKDLDITNWEGDIIEIEERPQTQKVAIFLENDKFSLRQKGVIAATDKPILIDSKLAEISVKTESGNKFLSVLPYDAVQTLLKTKVVNEVSRESLNIVEDGDHLTYKIEGNKVINFFNFYNYKIPVTSFVSASSGEILKVDSPTIYKYVTFLFV